MSFTDFPFLCVSDRLAHVADEHESLVFAVERRRSALPTRLSSTSSLANEMQKMFQVNLI